MKNGTTVLLAWLVALLATTSPTAAQDCPDGAAPRSTIKLLERLVMLDTVEARHGAEARTTALAPVGRQCTCTCTLKHSYFSYTDNRNAFGGGFITKVQGIVVNYPVGQLEKPELHVMFWDVSGSKKPEFLGQDMDFIEHPGTFEVSIETPHPPAKLALTWVCKP